MEITHIRRASESATHAAPSDITTMNSSGTGNRTDGDEASFLASNVNNLVHQRRRVNPESLAMRLGPDLVRDLNALITPGNMEMPSFAVRKELQERYNIDRRHIYDYFHSRGLRVVKEDKHGNPMTAKDFPTPLPNLRPLRQAPIKSNSRSHTSYPVASERKLFKPRGVTKAKPGRPKKNLSVNPKVVPFAANESNESAETNDDIPCEHSPDAVPTATYVVVNPLLPHIPLQSITAEDDNRTFNSVVNPPDGSFSVRRAVGDIAYAYRHRSVFERMQELTEYPARLDRLLSWSETSPCSSASDRGLLLPHAKPLTRDERQAIYESISDSLGPAQGIQECQGTYRKHMQTRAKLYFEGLLPVPHHHSQQPAKTSTSSGRKPPLGTSEFRHWLSETRFLKRDGANGSPRLHLSHQSANVPKQQEIGKQYRQIFVPHFTQTLDDLFPPLGDLNNEETIMDSPVAHTRQVPQPVPETPQAGHAQLHGLSGFSGTQEVRAWSFAELDRHGSSEHAPCVAYSRQHSTLNSTRRRARNMSNHARAHFQSHSPHKLQIRDLDRIWTRPVTSRDARRRTPSGAADI